MHQRALLAAAAVLLLAVASSGCLTVYPIKSILTTDPRASSIPYENHLAYERKENPTTTGCPSGTETRGILVPQGSEWISIYVSAKLTPWPPPFNQFDPAHFDFTVTDGNGTAWVDVHLKSNDTEKKVLVSGPRPGGWTVTLSYEICEGSIPGIKIDDQFNTQVIVRQPI